MKKIKQSVFAAILCGICFSSYAVMIDTVDTYSVAMKKQIKAVIIRPNSYSKLKELPVVYLLHGYSDNYGGWLNKAKGFEAAADLYNIMIVCPDGGYSSWYWDSPVDSAYRYETYVAGELVSWVDKNYKTIKSRTGRAITGLSMGGHGALYLAIKHQNVFGAAGSMSGGVDIRPFPMNWDMSKRLGTYAEHPENWEKNTVMNMLHLLTPGSLSICIECGAEDFFFRVNENLHNKMTERNIPHDYTVRPGSHEWGYWTNAVQYQLLFMHNYFQRPKSGK